MLCPTDVDAAVITEVERLVEVADEEDVLVSDVDVADDAEVAEVLEVLEVLFGSVVDDVDVEVKAGVVLDDELEVEVDVGGFVVVLVLVIVSEVEVCAGVVEVVPGSAAVVLVSIEIDDGSVEITS